MPTVSSPVLQSKKSGRSERPQEGTHSEDSRKSFTTTLLVLCPMPIFESSSDSEASSTRMTNDTEFEFNRQKITSKICAALV